MTDTPLGLVDRCLLMKIDGGRPATDQQLNALEAIRRLLLQVEVVHAMSWLWHNGAPSLPEAAAAEASRTARPTTPLTLMMPTLRRRAARRGVLLAALNRCVFG